MSPSALKEPSSNSILLDGMPVKPSALYTKFFTFEYVFCENRHSKKKFGSKLMFNTQSNITVISFEVAKTNILDNKSLLLHHFAFPDLDGREEKKINLILQIPGSGGPIEAIAPPCVLGPHWAFPMGYHGDPSLCPHVLLLKSLIKTLMLLNQTEEPMGLNGHTPWVPWFPMGHHGGTKAPGPTLIRRLFL